MSFVPSNQPEAQPQSAAPDAGGATGGATGDAAGGATGDAAGHSIGGRAYADTPSAGAAEGSKTTAPLVIVPRHTWVFRFMSAVYRLYMAVRGSRVVGAENVPRQGPVILAPNHISLLDPPLVGVTCGRDPYIMAKAELFTGILGWAIERMGSFPVRRGVVDRGAFKLARKLLGQGHALLIFPEGTRSRTGELGAPEAGVAMLAHGARALVVPVYIAGTERAFSPRHPGFRFVRAEIRYGVPLSFEAEYARKADRETLEAIGARIMTEISALRLASIGSAPGVGGTSEAKDETD